MGLIAWVFRLAGCLLLAAATVLAVGDAARSLASNRVRLMTIAEASAIVGLGLSEPGDAVGNAGRAGVFASDGRGADPLAVLGLQPASAVLGLGGIALLLVGRARRHPRLNDSSRTRKV